LNDKGGGGGGKEIQYCYSLHTIIKEEEEKKKENRKGKKSTRETETNYLTGGTAHHFNAS
jgi:hypothetical protein